MVSLIEWDKIFLASFPQQIYNENGCCGYTARTEDILMQNYCSETYTYEKNWISIIISLFVNAMRNLFYRSYAEGGNRHICLLGCAQC